MFARLFAVVLSFALTLLTISGCKPEGQTEPTDKYTLVVTTDGKALRLNTQSGQTTLVTEKGLTPLPMSGHIRLEVGAIYTLENGESVKYLGNQKFGSASNVPPDIQTILDKYRSEKKTPT